MRLALSAITGFTLGCVLSWGIFYWFVSEELEAELRSLAEQQVGDHMAQFEGIAAAKTRAINEALSVVEITRVLTIQSQHRQCELWSIAQTKYESLQRLRTFLALENPQAYSKDVATSAIIDNTIADYEALPKGELLECRD